MRRGLPLLVALVSALAVLAFGESSSPRAKTVSLADAFALGFEVPAAQPAGRPARFLLAVAAGGTATLLQSSDGVRFAPAPGFSPGPGTSPVPVRRGSTLYLYDSPSLSATGLGGNLRRFTVGAGGRLTEQAPASYQVQLASPEDAQHAAPGSFVPSFALDDAGALVLLYSLRFEPDTNACPVEGQACVKLRTATEAPAGDGSVFTGDPGNRIVLAFDPADAIGPPALLRADKGWAALLQGPAGCLHALTAPDPHKAYRNSGCISAGGPAGPSGLWDARLREYRLFGIVGGRVVRAVTTRLARVAPARFRPLVALPGRPSAARVAANVP
jgi:hypothetical protein